MAWAPSGRTIAGFVRHWSKHGWPGEMVFWDVHEPAQTIVVSLEHERYKKLIVEVSDVASTVARLRDALGVP